MKTVLVTIGILCQVLLVYSNPIVRVEQGEILGKILPFGDAFLGVLNNVDVFEGVPYAEPPIGERRFQAPVAKAPWGEGEIYNATYNRDVCLQPPGAAEVFGYTQSEDCLHLNIYAPTPQANAKAVMVWIHGGSLQRGSSYPYAGLPLAVLGDIILVTINYRLAALGFLTTGDDVFPGNYGMLDQVEALRWIKANIHAFGGDPNKITIFGESAGAVSVSGHLFSPLSQNLYEQAILQSGSMLASFGFVAPDTEYYIQETTYKLMEAVGCPRTDPQLSSCMREVDAQTIVTEAVKLGYYGLPRLDNVFLTETPLESLQSNNFKKCPMINGFNRDEGTLAIAYESEFGSQFLTSPDQPYVSKETFETEVPKFLTANGVSYNDLIVDSIQQEYVDWSMADDPEADYFDPWKFLAGDRQFSCPATRELRAHAMKSDQDLYQYYFTHVPSIGVYGPFGPGWLGAGHGEDISFVFGAVFDPLLGAFYSEEEKMLSKMVMKYWSNFAKTGNPNQETEDSAPYEDDRAWPAFTLSNLDYKELAVNLSSGRGLRADECHFWNDYIPKLMTYSADVEETQRQWKQDFYTWKYTDMEEWREAFDEYQTLINKDEL